MFPQHPDPAIAGDPQAAKQRLQAGFSAAGDGRLIDLAAAERQQAMKRSGMPQAPLPAKDQDNIPERGDWDRLVDQLDDMDL